MTAKELTDVIQTEWNKNPSRKRVAIAGETCKDQFDFEWSENGLFRLDNSVFEQRVCLQNFKKGSEIIFNKCTFSGDIHVHGLEEEVTLKFLYCNINNGMTIEDCKPVTLYMSHSKAKGSFSFENATFENCVFEEFTFLSLTDADEISFFNSIFKRCSFIKAILSNAAFNRTCFESNAYFDNAKLQYNSTPGTGNFFDAVFNLDAYFNFVDFTKGAFFNGSTFKGLAMFPGNNKDFDCIADYSGCKFEKNVFFDNSHYDHLEIQNAVFSTVASFQGMQCNEIKINRAVFSQYADFLDAEILRGDRNSFRTIKNEFLRHNNSVDALEYQAKELREFESTLHFDKRWKEKFVLYFYKISNDFNTNWVKGLWFTLLSTIAFYTLYIFTLPGLKIMWQPQGWDYFLNSVNSTMMYFFKFFIITHDLDFMKGFKPNFLSYLIDSIGRIFIGYGIYQTVQAFRKYGK